MEFEELSGWCKWLEKNFSPEVMIPKLPVIIRLDGNNFSSWTKGLEKPFDSMLTELMIETTKFLVKETNAIVAYHQSDEITLILYSPTRKNSIYHEGKKQKILSKLTGKCVDFFNQKRLELLPNHNKRANFDCRIYQTPTLEDACAQLLWRENDATRNSKQMLGHAHFSHNELNKLNTDQIQDRLMLEKNINWNDLLIKYKRGTYVKRVVTSKPFSKEELDKLPLKHNAHRNPDLLIERSIIKEIEYPIFNKIDNRVDVIFNDLEPILKK
jgi:tRNA(His) 5'-end guanylyltransferase